jgi:aerobic carbon-monoxide dehydrogenase medium subunit
MKPAPFEYHRPGSVEEAVALLAEHGWEAKPLAGGQSLVPAMNFRLAQPAVLVDLNGLTALDELVADGGGLSLGAMVRQRRAERSAAVAGRAPLLAAALRHVAHPQIRVRGTVGGSLAHADPAAELPAVMVALGARLTVRGPRGERSVEADDFFTGLFGTSLEDAELLVGVHLPAPPAGGGWAFDEVSRRHGDFALAGVAATVEVDAGGRCTASRIVLFGIGDGPVRATAAEALLAGEAPTPAAVRAAAEAAAAALDPPADVHASADYRRHLAGVMVRRALPRAFDRAAASTAA